MTIIIAWVLTFSAYQGHSDQITTTSPFLYPTKADCLRVAQNRDGSACVQTRVLVAK